MGLYYDSIVGAYSRGGAYSRIYGIKKRLKTSGCYHVNLVTWPKLPRASCSSVVERSTGVQKVIGSTSIVRTRKCFSK